MNDVASMDSASIQYPWSNPPAPGEILEIAPRILWTRMSLPFALNHVNVWILDEGDCWTVIDCGAATNEADETWTRLLAGALSAKPVRRLVATHGHTDHIGFAGPFCDMTGASFHITRTEWMSAVIRRTEKLETLRDQASSFYSRNGCSNSHYDDFLRERERSATFVAPLPPSYARLRNGAQIAMGGRPWMIITAGGHAPEHAMFHCETDRILIAGDQVLPRITPQIGVNHMEPEEDPLSEFLESLTLLSRMDADTLVLPSHGMPYRGIRTRTTQIIQHHAVRLNHVRRELQRPRTAFEVAERIFEDAIAKGHARFAFAETLSHINNLLRQGEAVRLSQADGTFLYRLRENIGGSVRSEH